MLHMWAGVFVFIGVLRGNGRSMNTRNVLLCFLRSVAHYQCDLELIWIPQWGIQGAGNRHCGGPGFYGNLFEPALLQGQARFLYAAAGLNPRYLMNAF